nr:MAG TPA: hypothetical protein [Caudoviricetes sp.]
MIYIKSHFPTLEKLPQKLPHNRLVGCFCPAVLAVFQAFFSVGEIPRICNMGAENQTA